MASVLSAELRGRVVAAIGAGASRREAARRFEISPVSAERWRAVVVQEGRTGVLRGDTRGRLAIDDRDFARVRTGTVIRIDKCIVPHLIWEYRTRGCNM